MLIPIFISTAISRSTSLHIFIYLYLSIHHLSMGSCQYRQSFSNTVRLILVFPLFIFVAPFSHSEEYRPHYLQHTYVWSIKCNTFLLPRDHCPAIATPALTSHANLAWLASKTKPCLPPHSPRQKALLTCQPSTWNSELLQPLLSTQMLSVPCLVPSSSEVACPHVDTFLLHPTQWLLTKVKAGRHTSR